MAGSSFLAMLSLALFLLAAWSATRISKLAGVSPILLEVAVGVLMGPSVLRSVPSQYSSCLAARRFDCIPPPNLPALIAKGKLLDRGLQMVTDDPDLCPPEAYPGQDAPDGDEGGEGPSGAEGPYELYNWTNDTEDSSGSGGGEEESANTTSQDEGAMEVSSEDADVPDSEEGQGPPTAAAAEAEGGPGRHRRLGAVAYASYEECLVRNCEKKVRDMCGGRPDFLSLVGQAGVALLLFESGLHFDAARATAVVPKAGAAAMMGAAVPVMTGATLMRAFGSPLFPDGLAVGVALAPSSVGIALRLLSDSKVLQEDFGQAIISAAFLDNVLSLLLFNILFSLDGSFDAVETAVFPLVALVLAALSMYLAIHAFPRLVSDGFLSLFPAERGSGLGRLRKDEALLFLMVAVLIGYGTATHYLGTHLWGCFLAGVLFSCLEKEHQVQHLWAAQTKRAAAWLVRLFFAATIAFAVPVASLLSASAFLKGTLMGLGPCILAKVVCAPFLGTARWVAGWALVGRAELAFLIAQMALSTGKISQDAFSITLWALLYSTIVAPLVFRRVLDRYVSEHRVELRRPPLEAQQRELGLLGDRSG